MVFNESYIFGEQTIILWCGHKSFGAQLVQSNGSQWDRIEVEKNDHGVRETLPQCEMATKMKEKNTRKQNKIKSHERSNKRIRSHKAEISLSKPNIEYIYLFIYFSFVCFVCHFCMDYIYIIHIDVRQPNSDITIRRLLKRSND